MFSFPFVPSFSILLRLFPPHLLLGYSRAATTLHVLRVALNEIAFIMSIALPFDEEPSSQEATLPFDFSWRNSHHVTSRRSGKKLRRVCRLGFFAPINIDPRLYRVVARKIFRSLSSAGALIYLYMRDIGYTHRNTRLHRVHCSILLVEYYDRNFYEN